MMQVLDVYIFSSMVLTNQETQAWIRTTGLRHAQGTQHFTAFCVTLDYWGILDPYTMNYLHGVCVSKEQQCMCVYFIECDSAV